MDESQVQVLTELRTSTVDGCWRVNNYAFLAHLGSGAYGEVVLARDTDTGRLVVRLRISAGF